ncbi:MAG: methyltransferase domain-containing protein [Betaproteobacteria bacterium]|nr:methyltransferase domain-containing protein [Betaproteobacteria bacterium]
MNPYLYTFDPDTDFAPARVVRMVGQGKRVLELGTGPGSMTRVLKEHCGCAVTGVELDGESAAAAAPFCERMIVADLDAPDGLEALGDERFEAIVAAEVLEHLRCPEELLRRIKQHLLPGASLVVSVPMVSYLGIFAALLQDRFPYAEKGLLDATHVHLFTKNELERILNAAGYRIEECHGVALDPEDSEFAHLWKTLPEEWRARLKEIPALSFYQCVARAVVDGQAERVALARDETAAMESAWCAEHQARRRAEEARAHAEHETAAVRAYAERESAAARAQMDAMLNSHSWKITAPLRKLNELAGKTKRLPRAGLPGLRRKLSLPLLTAKRVMAYYRNWGFKNTLRRIAQEARRRVRSRFSQGTPALGLWNLSTVKPEKNPNPGRIAVQAHIFYPDLIGEISTMLAAIPYSFDLYVSVPNDEVAEACRKAFSASGEGEGRAGKLSIGKLSVELVPNRGRDIAPLVAHFGARLRHYDFIAHLHTKKSLHNKEPAHNWRQYLCLSLFGSSDRVRRIFGLFSTHPEIGIVYPLNILPHWSNTWLANRAAARAWCERFGLAMPRREYFHYPAGSMFWARGKALEPLLGAGLRPADFPDEKGQTDGTPAHVIERLFALSAQHQGFVPAVLEDTVHRGWSPWRIDVYLAQRFSDALAKFESPGLKVVAFDVFDTLLLRPYLDTETAKAIVAARLDEELGIQGLGERYLALRFEAERRARERLGRDVALDDICAEFASLSGLDSGLDAGTAKRLAVFEESVEAAALAPREDVVKLLSTAHMRGLRTVLASDMFLPRKSLEAMLEANGIKAGEMFDALYLSNELDARKDTGKLYPLILERESAAVSEFLMIGDNERSDVQIPVDMGAQVLHVMRPIDIACALPRWNALLARIPEAAAPASPASLDHHLTLGLIIRRMFGQGFYGELPPNAGNFANYGAFGIGYCVVGPMLFAFADWLRESARADGVERLLFLSREGQILKAAYDRICAADKERPAPESDYIVLSRRVVTLAQLGDKDEKEGVAGLRELAQEFYAQNTLERFLHYRYGYDLSPEERADLDQRGLWRRGRPVEIHEGSAVHLYPLLDVLAPKILANAAIERAGLLAYLEGFHLGQTRAAIVDVGYAATTQDHLCRFLGRTIDGYYMMSSRRADAVAERHGVAIRGCFGEKLVAGQGSLALWLRHFQVEQMLSSDDPQINCYRIGEDGRVRASFQALDDAERAAFVIRAEVRRGAFAFIDEALGLRKRLYPRFTVPPKLADALFDTLTQSPSPAEEEILAGLVLDDHYCGRGIVSLEGTRASLAHQRALMRKATG